MWLSSCESIQYRKAAMTASLLCAFEQGVSSPTQCERSVIDDEETRA
jgi:hypothetical protein